MTTTALQALVAAFCATFLASMVWAYFIVKDAIAAFDGDPTTATASQKIQEWKRKRGMHGTVFLGFLILLLALAGTCFIILSTWLFFHLVQEAL